MDGVKHLLSEVLEDHQPPHSCGDVTPHQEPLNLESYQVMRLSDTQGSQVLARGLCCG